MSGRAAVRRAGGTAVVVGASMAGLCAARVLAERFDRVEVLDRDGLPDGAEPRGQVPQGRHPHLLLVEGARLLEQSFPGLGVELRAAGAIEVDLTRDVYWYQGGGVARRPPSDLRSPTMTRPLLEGIVRHRLEAFPHVSLRGGTAVAGLEVDRARACVTGVRLGDGSTIASDLVVDATGRQARSLGWLEALGYEVPETTTVHVDTRYATTVHRRGPLPERDWEAAMVVDHPSSRRLGMAVPVEGDRWLVLLGGMNGEAPPTEPNDRLAFARSLPSPVIADVIEASEPLGATVTHRFPSDQRRHVERLRRFPVGWVVLGDAVCSFDPIYGQGMTSAAQQAALLGRCLDRSAAIDRRFARRYFRGVSRTVAVPWSMAVGGDFAYAGTTGQKPTGTDLLNRYTDRMITAAQHDDAVAIRFTEVGALVRRPEALLTPAFAARVLVGSRR